MKTIPFFKKVWCDMTFDNDDLANFQLHKRFYFHAGILVREDRYAIFIDY